MRSRRWNLNRGGPVTRFGMEWSRRERIKSMIDPVRVYDSSVNVANVANVAVQQRLARTLVL
jgi:hypothetical protein